MMTNGSIVRWKNSVQAKAQMKQILTYLAGLNNLKAQSIASLLAMRMSKAHPAVNEET